MFYMSAGSDTSLILEILEELLSSVLNMKEWTFLISDYNIYIISNNEHLIDLLSILNMIIGAVQFLDRQE